MVSVTILPPRRRLLPLAFCLQVEWSFHLMLRVCSVLQLGERGRLALKTQDIFFPLPRKNGSFHVAGLSGS